MLRELTRDLLVNSYLSSVRFPGIMGRKCGQCGMGTMKRTEHHFEKLNVCVNCGASEALSFQFAHHGSPVKSHVR